jgi:pimeloyl-ACP methyl ester carboxylesterase
VLEGSEVCMAARWSAHAAFTAECIGSEKDWSEVVKAATVPVLLLQGDEDPQAPVETMRELAADYPGVRMRFLPGNGQLLLFSEWPTVLDEVEALLGRDDRMTQGQ